MNSRCPVYKVLNAVGKKWALIIITEIYKGSEKWKHYSQIKDKIKDITPKMMSRRLKELEKEKIIKKKIDIKHFPISTEYSLTDRGEELVEIIKEMRIWGLKWKIKNEYCESVDCRDCEL